MQMALTDENIGITRSSSEFMFYFYLRPRPAESRDVPACPVARASARMRACSRANTRAARSRIARERRPTVRRPLGRLPRRLPGRLPGRLLGRRPPNGRELAAGREPGIHVVPRAGCDSSPAVPYTMTEEGSSYVSEGPPQETMASASKHVARPFCKMSRPKREASNPRLGTRSTDMICPYGAAQLKSRARCALTLMSCDASRLASEEHPWKKWTTLLPIHAPDWDSATMKAVMGQSVPDLAAPPVPGPAA